MNRPVIEETLDLFRQIKGDPTLSRRLSEQIYSLNEGIAFDVARVFSASCNLEQMPFEDILQTSKLGLWRAVRLFDITIGASFPAFAYPKCRSELMHYRRDHGSAMKSPRAWSEKSNRARTLTQKINKHLPPDQHIDEATVAAIEYGWTKQEWKQAVASTQRNKVSSLDAGEGDFPLRAASSPQRRIEARDDAEQQRWAIASCLSRVPADAQQYVMMHHVNGMKIPQIAKAFGTTPSKVKTAINSALATMGGAA